MKRGTYQLKLSLRAKRSNLTIAFRDCFDTSCLAMTTKQPLGEEDQRGEVDKEYHFTSGLPPPTPASLSQNISFMLGREEKLLLFLRDGLWRLRHQQ
ncbi:MAG: hypothetical protein KAI42_04380, partial [Dehalococcoidales bacterium]|nr:hypothetical protein [Dehalococcoidales bacterium]